MFEVFEVERDVPRPAHRKTRPHIYPFREMEPGDSFRVPGDLVTRVRSAAKEHGRRYEKKFSVLKTDEGYRCWRTE